MPKKYSKELKISVVMPVWVLDDDLYRLTATSIQSLKLVEDYNAEMIIVDNASPIGGDQLMAQSDIYIRNRVNLGYPKAVNQGIKLSSGELVCVANNDIKVSPNYIKVSQEVFTKLPKAGSLHFKMLYYDEPFNLGDSVWDHGKEKWCHGSFFVFRRKAYDDIKGIDEGYGLGGYDDYDWQYRMRKKGWKTAYTNGAAFQHKDSSTQNLLDQDERKTSDNKNREYFKKRHGEYPDTLWNKMYPEQVDIPWRPFP